MIQVVGRLIQNQDVCRRQQCLNQRNPLLLSPRLETLSLLAKYLNISLDSVIFHDNPPADPYIEQIIYELNDCTDEEKQLALHTLRGLLEGLRKQK